MSSAEVQPREPVIRRYDSSDSVAEITLLLHRAYAELAAMGFRYLATHQDDTITLERLTKGEAYVAVEAERIVGTITYVPPGLLSGSDWYGRDGIGGFTQFGVDPDRQRRGIGRALLATVEARARESGCAELACDTAEGARHLIDLYERHGYRIVDTADWDVTNYRSVILSKRL